MNENEIARIIVNAAIEVHRPVHRTLGGPGLLEAVDEEALAQALTYLCDLRLAFVFHFGERQARQSIH